jgi:hypothetical protein
MATRAPVSLSLHFSTTPYVPDKLVIENSYLTLSYNTKKFIFVHLARQATRHTLSCKDYVKRETDTQEQEVMRDK